MSILKNKKNCESQAAQNCKINFVSAAFVFILISAVFSFSSFADEVGFPAPDAAPKTLYQSVTSVIPNPFQLVYSDNVERDLALLRQVASLTMRYHADLLSYISGTSTMNSAHLILFLDAVYYPEKTHSEMLKLLSDSRLCDGLDLNQCKLRTSQIESNAQAAVFFGVELHRILSAGLERVNSLSTDQAKNLIDRIYPGLADTDHLFSEILSMTASSFSPDVKRELFEMAIAKSAISSVLTLGMDRFSNDTDESVGALVETLKEIPGLELRDKFLFSALGIVKNLEIEGAVQLVSISGDKPRVARALMARLAPYTANDLSRIAGLCPMGIDRDAMISGAIKAAKITSSADIIRLVQEMQSNKGDLAESLYTQLPNSNADDLISVLRDSLSGAERDGLLTTEFPRFKSLSARQAKSLIELATSGRLGMIISVLPKLVAPSANDLGLLVSILDTGPERDQALLAGVSSVVSADREGIKAVLKFAYLEKVKTVLALLPLVTNLSAGDVADIASGAVLTSSRDAILVGSVDFVKTVDPLDLVSMIMQADQSKAKIAIALLPRKVNLSAADLAVVMTGLIDGIIRDQVLDQAIGFLKVVDGAGAAKVVERSFNNKVPNAVRLLKMIPNSSGNDLDQILAVCGSGMTRDQILSQAIVLLDLLTGEQARSIFARAYTHKEDVAISLMSKINVVDGITIASMASLLAKGSSRDLVISEGLKHLVTVDAEGLIAMIRVADQIQERLVIEMSAKIPNFKVETALIIVEEIPGDALKTKFILRAIDLVSTLEESDLTMLALAAPEADRAKIIKKGLGKIVDDFVKYEGGSL